MGSVLEEEQCARIKETISRLFEKGNIRILDKGRNARAGNGKYPNSAKESSIRASACNGGSPAGNFCSGRQE